MHLVVHVAWKKNGQRYNYILRHGHRVANGLAGWAGTWKENDWKIDDKEIWGRGM